jgi:hypothetical protein
VKIFARARVGVGQRQEIGDVVHQALVDVLNVPRGERFQILAGLAEDQMIIDPHFPAVDRRDPVLIEITLVRGVQASLKRRLYRVIADGLQAVGVRGDDVFVVLVENGLMDWSAADGLAHLVREAT